MKELNEKTKCGRCGKLHTVTFQSRGFGWVCISCKCYLARLDQIAAKRAA